MSIAEVQYFFSYARKDAEFVLKLATKLRAVGVNLWLDQLDILGGQRWDQAVEGALEACQGMIAVLSPESLASNNMMDEVSYALDKEKLVVPVILRPCNIPFRLRRIQHIDFNIDYVSLSRLNVKCRQNLEIRYYGAHVVTSCFLECQKPGELKSR